MDYWLKQTAEKPLFPDLLWSRPENRGLAGKLLIIGGSSHGFAAPAEAYQAAVKAGAGTVKVLLPDATKRFVGKFLETAEFAPSTPSGSFAQKSLDSMLDIGAWADGVLLAGDFGRNSETAVALEKFIRSYNGSLVITKDGIDYFLGSTDNPGPRTSAITLVLSMAQLQKLAAKLKFSQPFTLGMDLLPLVRALYDFSISFSLNIVVKHHRDILVACDGQVSSTRLDPDMNVWRVKTAAAVAVWQLQNPAIPFKALTTALTDI